MPGLRGRFSLSPGLIFGLAAFAAVLLIPSTGQFTPQIRNMLAAAVLMAVWWMTEALPLAVTSLLPLALYPLLGIMDTEAVAPNYANHLIFLFMGGFMIAIALQEWELHRRFALGILSLLGSNPRRVILSFMLSTAVLSMWLSNTATTLLMLPIGLAVIEQFKTGDQERSSASRNNLFAIVLMLGIAYSASIGGIATLIGTAPNLIFSGIYEKFFPAKPGVTFVDWFILIFPLSVLVFLALWLYLTYGVLRREDLPRAEARDFFVKQKRLLGPLKVPQKLVLAVFSLTAFLWIFRSDIDLNFVELPGWPGLFGLQGRVEDSTIAVAMSVLLFVIPVKSGGKVRALLVKKNLSELPWDVLLLFGGGFALADGIQKTGLAEYLGNRLVFLGHMPLLLMLFLLTISVALLTEFTSNTAVATTVLPIVAVLSVDLNVDPMVLLLPATVAASCAFMLPVSTPPNAIVFGSNLIPIKKMVRIGAVLIVLASVIVSLYFYL